jgi:hypothetical protein
MSRDLVLSGLAEEGFTLGAGRQPFGLLSQSFGFSGKANFERLDLLEAAS